MIIKIYHFFNSLGFFLAILGTTTIMSEMRDLNKRRMRLENKYRKEKRLLETKKKYDIDEGFVDYVDDDDGYEEGYFSLYSCDKTSYMRSLDS